MLNVVRKATQTIPIVFTMVPDPVKLGIVANLARPGGNVTGFTNFEFSMGGKWLELLKEMQPSLKRVLLISNPLNPNNVEFSKQIEGQGRDFGLDIGTAEVREQRRYRRRDQQSSPRATERRRCWRCPTVFWS